MALEFGYYPRSYDETIGNITLSTLPDLEAKIAAVTSSSCVKRGWFFAPDRSRVFALPKTHALTYAQPTSDEHLQFLVWCFGFFVGMRMSWAEAGFVDATPVEMRGTGAMSDIMWLGDSLEKAIAGADAFWQKRASNPRIAKILTGAIHTYFLAQPNVPYAILFPYEAFNYLYIAFDSCHAIHETIAGQNPRDTVHGKRIKNLCKAFGIDIPPWADSITQLPPEVTTVRNNALHEALFLDEPLGFQGFGGGTLSEHILAEMTALVRRFIVALLELPATDYIRSPISSRQKEGVRL